MLVAEERYRYHTFGREQPFRLNLDARKSAANAAEGTRGVTVAPTRDERQMRPQPAQVVRRLLPESTAQRSRERGSWRNCLLDDRGQHCVERPPPGLTLEVT